MTIPKSSTTVGRLLRASYGMRFFKTIKDQDENGNDIDYPAEEDNPTTYKARMLKNVSFLPQQGGFGLTYEETQKTDYIFNLEVEKYIEEGTVVLGFYFPGNTLEEGRWYTIDKVIEKETEENVILIGHLQVRAKVYTRDSKGNKIQEKDSDGNLVFDENNNPVYEFTYQDGTVSRVDPVTGEVLWVLDFGSHHYGVWPNGKPAINYGYPMGIDISDDGYAYILYMYPQESIFQEFDTRTNQYMLKTPYNYTHRFCYFRGRINPGIKTKIGIIKINMEGKVIWNLDLVTTPQSTESVWYPGNLCLDPNTKDNMWIGVTDENQNFLKNISIDGEVIKKIHKNDPWKQNEYYEGVAGQYNRYHVPDFCKVKVDKHGNLFYVDANQTIDPRTVGLKYINPNTNEVLFAKAPYSYYSHLPLVASDGFLYGQAWVINAGQNYTLYGGDPETAKTFDYDINTDTVIIGGQRGFTSSNIEVYNAYKAISAAKMNGALNSARYWAQYVSGYFGYPATVAYSIPAQMPMPSGSGFYSTSWWTQTNNGPIGAEDGLPFDLIVNPITATFSLSKQQGMEIYNGLITTKNRVGTTTLFDCVFNYINTDPSIVTIQEPNPFWFTSTAARGVNGTFYAFRGASGFGLDCMTYQANSTYRAISHTIEEHTPLLPQHITDNTLNGGITATIYNPTGGILHRFRPGLITSVYNAINNSYTKFAPDGLCCALKTVKINKAKIKEEREQEIIFLSEQDENTP